MDHGTPSEPFAGGQRRQRDVRSMSDQALSDAERDLINGDISGAQPSDLVAVQTELKRRADLKRKADEDAIREATAGIGFPDTLWLVWDHLKLEMLPIPDEKRANVFVREGYAVVKYERSRQ